MRYDMRIHVYTVMGVMHWTLTVHDPQTRTATSPPLLRVVNSMNLDLEERDINEDVRDMLVAILEEL